MVVPKLAFQPETCSHEHVGRCESRIHPSAMDSKIMHLTQLNRSLIYKVKPRLGGNYGIHPQELELFYTVPFIADDKRMESLAIDSSEITT